MKNIVLDGKSLTVSQVNEICKESTLQVQIGQKAKAEIRKSHEFTMAQAGKAVIYGVNTGFGPMANRLLANDQIWDLQLNLIRSHAAGMGDPVKPEIVLAAMLIRLNTLAQGLSGVSLELLERLRFFINKRIIPFVPEHGAVGTSGDLVQLAHIALALIGEGRVWHNGRLQKTSGILAKFKLRGYVLKPKEGLALINGTSFMSGAAALVCQEAEGLIGLSVVNGSLALETVRGYKDSFSEELHKARPHAGQVHVAAIMRKILASSALLRDRDHRSRARSGTDVEEMLEIIQEVYSLRCIAQIIGPIHETVQRVKGIVETEINSVTDNPIVDLKRKRFLHGGNFHGDYIASNIDQLKAAMVKLTMLSERRINFFLNRNVNKFLPPFLNLRKPGLTLALQGLQFVATSTAGNSQTLAYPAHLHSIPTNADNQDVVSMGTDAALIAARVVDNASIVIAIETAVLAQAVDYLKIGKSLSKTTGNLYRTVRSALPAVTDDRSLTEDMEKLRMKLKVWQM